MYLKRMHILAALVLVASFFVWHEHAVSAKQTSMRLESDGPTFTNVSMSVPGFMPVYNSSGTALSGTSCVLVTGNSTTSGTFSASYTASPLWSGTPTIWLESFTIISPGTGVTQRYITAVSTLTSTSISGTVQTGTVLTLLGATTVSATTAVPFTAKICGQ